MIFSGRRNVLLLFGVLINSTVVLVFLMENLIKRPAHSDCSANTESNWANAYPKVVIAAVSCRNLSGTKVDYNMYTITMLKSVLISAQKDHVPAVDIHLFLEHPDPDAEFIKRNVMVDYKFKGSYPLDVNIYNYSAVDLVPTEYRNTMIYDKRYRCGFTRLFIPHALPKVDSIIHLDSDMIITGSILKLWKELGRMNSAQMIGAGFNRHENNNYYPKSDRRYLEFPHVSSKGLNNGLLIMNLTRLRQFGWEEKTIQAYRDYSKLSKLITGQAVVNILAYYNPSMLQIIPCNLHFIYYACQMEWFCTETDADPQGIHLVHGLNFGFKEGRTWNGIYNIYKQFNVSSPTADFYRDVVLAVREHYSKINKTDQCYGTVNSTLFKDYS